MSSSLGGGVPRVGGGALVRTSGADIVTVFRARFTPTEVTLHAVVYYTKSNNVTNVVGSVDYYNQLSDALITTAQCP